MPFLAYVHSERGERPEGPRPWQPNWRLWRWLVPALVVGYAAAHSDGALATLLIFVVFGICCRAVLELVPEADGLRDWRQ